MAIALAAVGWGELWHCKQWYGMVWYGQAGRLAVVCVCMHVGGGTGQPSAGRLGQQAAVHSAPRNAPSC